MPGAVWLLVVCATLLAPGPSVAQQERADGPGRTAGTRQPPDGGAGATAGDPFARRGWHLELAGQGGIETWNYNSNHEEMFGSYAGLAYGLGKGLVLTVGSPLYYVSQRGVDGYMLGLTWGVRGRVYRRGRTSVFWEVEVGFSESDTLVPPRGTRFNYLALGSAGATVRVRDRVHLLAALKWVHVSNNSLAGRDRNPDIEAVGPKVGMLIGF